MVIAGAVLSVGSAAANSFGTAAAARARNNALAAERQRQAAYDQQQAGLVDASRDRYLGFEGQQDAEAADLAALYQGENAGAPEASTGILPVSDSSITIANENVRRGEARRSTDQQGAALARLRSFGDVLGGIGRLNARDAGTLQQISGFKMGSNNALPYELDAAQQQGAGMRLLGDVLGGAGQIAIGKGLQGPTTGATWGPALLKRAASGGPVRLGG